MAYDPTKLKLSTPRFGLNFGPRQWEYVSDDAMTTVRAANYISDALVRGMQPGDQVRVVQTTAGAISAVTQSVALTVAASGADLADGTAITVTNS